MARLRNKPVECEFCGNMTYRHKYCIDCLQLSQRGLGPYMEKSKTEYEIHNHHTVSEDYPNDPRVDWKPIDG